MLSTHILCNRRDGERGVVLIVVLVIAFAFAILGFTVLRSSLTALESTETSQHSFMAKNTAEGAMNRASWQILNQLDPHSGYIQPSDAVTNDYDALRNMLLEDGTSRAEQLDSFPTIVERSAYTFGREFNSFTTVSHVIPGDPSYAQYRYLDDDTFTEDFAAREFTEVQREGETIVYGIGEVDDTNSDMAALSFLQSKYPTVQWNFDTRETGVTEPSRLGPYPYIESEHPYGNAQAREWVVTYQSDPRHPGRHLTGLRLMAEPDEVQIDMGDRLILSAWLEDQKRFQIPGEIPAAHILSNYTNGASPVFSQILDTTAIGIYFATDNVPPPSGMDFGFRVSGVRYNFDEDRFLAYYETPHPYDKIIDTTSPAQWNVQVIFAPWQQDPLSPVAVPAQMRIRFDDNFSLDPLDTLFVLNTTMTSGAPPVEIFDATTPPMPGSFITPITSGPGNYPLGYILLLKRPIGAGDSDGMPNYGYKVVDMEYTDGSGNVIRVVNPVMETPHNKYLGEIQEGYVLPLVVGLPATLPVPNISGFQTIYMPAVPDTDNMTGLGTVSEWFVTFDEATSLTATSSIANEDVIQIRTPGNPLEGLSDTVFYVHPDSNLGVTNLGFDPRYREIWRLGTETINCGTASQMQIAYLSDAPDSYEASLENFGYRIAEVGYRTPDGSDDDASIPTIRSDVNYPLNTRYPSFGSDPIQLAEWWYANDNALVVGLHFDRANFNIDPGDRIEIYDDVGLLIATLVSESVLNRPQAGGPSNPDDPTGGSQGSGAPGAGGPYVPEGVVAASVIDLDSTYGWVLIPGTTARVRLVGDSDDNEGYSGFEIDHCGFVNGDMTEIRAYVEDYQQLAYDQYYDRIAESMSSFGPIGIE